MNYQVEALQVLQPATRTPPNISRSKNCNTQRTENKTTDMVIHQQSRRLLKMDILMSETCWAHNNWNKITSDIKLVFHSITIAMMHGPINIRCAKSCKVVSFGMYISVYYLMGSIPVDARSKPWVCGLESRAGGTDVCPLCALCVSSTCHCNGMIARPEESYRVWCVWVWSWNLWPNSGCRPGGGWIIKRHCHF